MAVPLSYSRKAYPDSQSSALPPNMSHLLNRHSAFIALASLFLLPVDAQAQSVTAAPDGLGTTIQTTQQSTGSLYDISGGTPSGDGATLFHSFEQFGLLTGETAQFANPTAVENILGRVIGGDASIIDGLLEVSGSANLYLLNPAGVLLGENARLNLGGDFSASTATGIAFGDTLFDALGTADLGAITGSPTEYMFGAAQAGAVLNAGDLTVNQGQSLTLLGGQVINTGRLSAPGGEILVMAVPGEHRVRLSQDSSLLGLELATLPNESSTQPDFTASTLPTLLTGAGDLNVATHITLNADGSVSLSGSTLAIPVSGGTAIAGGTLTTESLQNSPQGGTIGILGERVALANATVDASGATGGGTILIGGDRLGNGAVPNATATVIDEASFVQANALDGGDGGTIIAWGSELLRTSGQLAARGGSQAGNGGFVETSSLGVLDIGTSPDVSASDGLGGTWLIDPPDLRIIEDAVDGISINVTDSNPFVGDGSQTEAFLGIDLIQAALTDGASVEVRTGGSAPGDGDIILEAPLDYNGTGSNSLRLIAEGVIRILEPIFDSEVDSSEIAGDSLDLTLRSHKIVSIENTIDVGDGEIILEARQGPLNEDLLGETEFLNTDDAALFENLSPDSKILGLSNLTGETLTLRPIEADQPYSLVSGGNRVAAGGSTGSFFGPLVSPDELAEIFDGFESVTIGSSIDTGDVFFPEGRLSLGRPTTFLTNSGRFIFRDAFLSTSFLVNSEQAITFDATQRLEIVGDIDINDNTQFISSGDIVLDNILSNGSDLSLISRQGDIQVGDVVLFLNLDAPADFFFPNGTILLQAPGTITTGNLATFNSRGDGGTVKILSETSITTGAIDTGSVNGDAGNVLLDPPGDVIFTSIDATSTTGAGGDVTIVSTEGTVRGTGVLSSNPSATISTEGVTTDGSITITHGGGTTIPFEIGNAAINGTLGALSAGATALAADNPNNPFFGSFTLGDIQLITSDAPGATLPAVDCVTDCRVVGDLNLPSDPDLLTMRSSKDPEILFARLEDRLTSEFVEYLSPGFASPRVRVAAQANATGAAPSDSGAASPVESDASASFIDQLELGQSPEIIDLPTAQAKLLTVQSRTGKKPALIYAVFGSNLENGETIEADILKTSAPSDPLELLLVTAEGNPIYIPLGVTRAEVITMAQRLRRQVSTPSRVDTDTDTYLLAAQTLYKWLVEPLQAELEAQGIDTISFITDAGLRSTPLAALHDGQQFIIENYQVGLMPSLSLTDLTYQDIRSLSALVTGTADFAVQAQLPSVPIELQAISSKWDGDRLQDGDFILDKLMGERQQTPYGIIHLATHGEFTSGDLSQSYIQLYDQRLRLHQLRTLGLHRPALELLTLSACQTALGNRSAELGFAGFAVLAGAKTSVASLWSVSDEASAGLMIEFYRQLQGDDPIIKAEALRRAQLSMLRGDIFAEGDQLVGLTQSRPLPPELIIEGRQNFSHPYYWAAFSLVGSPW